MLSGDPGRHWDGERLRSATAQPCQAHKFGREWTIVRVGDTYLATGEERVDGRPARAALLSGRHSHRSPQASLPDRAESRSLVESAAWATKQKRRRVGVAEC